MPDEKQAWLEKLGVTFPDQPQASGKSGGGADSAALAATETTMFFKLDDAELTPADRAALDAYAAKYAAAKSSEPVKAEGWASVDGTAARNAVLSTQRAKAAADYLISKGVPKGQVSARGAGPTDQFDKTNPASNRRVTITPAPASASGSASADWSPNILKTPTPTLDLNSPGAKKALQEMLDQVTEDEAWIRKELTTNALRPDPMNTKGDMVLYRNKTTALTDVLKDTVKDGQSAPVKSHEFITLDRVQRIAGEVLLAAAPGGGKMGGKSLFNVSVYLQVVFTPKGLHKPTSGGPETHDQPATQVQFQITAELHGKDESGIEISGSVAGTFFADDKGKKVEWQSATGGAQIAWVQTFLNGNLQVGPQLQVTFGGSRAVMDKTQKIEWTPTGQISAGVQAQFKVPGFDGHLLVGWQAGGGLTAPGGSKATADRAVGFTLTYQF